MGNGAMNRMENRMTRVSSFLHCPITALAHCLILTVSLAVAASAQHHLHSHSEPEHHWRGSRRFSSLGLRR
jgi:hypothetical protein